jgi:MATE family multidrug resistance protein
MRAVAAEHEDEAVGGGVGHWAVGLPVALLLGFHFDFGIVGLWWGLCAGLTVVALLLFLRFERLSRGEITPIHAATSLPQLD